MQNKAKPFVKWVGGKSQLISAIEQIFPKNFSKSKITYIEPFVGGGAVFFWIMQNYPNINRAIINDINPDLTTTYRTIKNDPQKLILLLRDIQNKYLPLNEEKRKEY